MKKIIVLFVMAIASLSCSNENQSVESKAGASTSNAGDYNIAVSVSPDGSQWTYTITRAIAKAKNLSHFIIDLNNCGDNSATFANIVWATVNGSPADLSPSEGAGTGCNPQASTNNFVKFDNLQAANSWVLVLKFDRGYETFATATGWIKAGSSCSQVTMVAPGCPIEEYCSFSQGFFFANGNVNNGAGTFWTNGLTIGGITYTQTQGNIAWNTDRGRGGDQTMNGFFQLGAVRLSGVESEVAADAAIIDAYFTGLNVFSTLVTTTGNNAYSYFNLPATSNGVTKAQVIAAGGRIGTYVDANHCE
ncbi:hypothetical protein [Flavobacterium sp.]|uniref:hypothetical protein n=1 Tax=Flavobacterium sp. TaxID=239 RepID=UPI00391BF023